MKKLELIEGWKKAYAFYSIWVFALLGVAPDIFNLAVQYGMVDSATAPVIFSRIINTLAFVGAVSRIVQQKKTELDAATPAAS